jgi:hypothetical protein
MRAAGERMFVFRLISRMIGFVVKSVVFVAAMAVVAGGVMYGLFDGDQYKQALIRRFEELTGRTLAIDGPAELQLGWPPRIVLNNVRIGNARWGARPDMARIDRVTIKLDPLAAVSGDNSLAQVQLDGTDVLFETNASGQGNWEFLLGGAATGGVLAGLAAIGIFGSAQQAVAALSGGLPGGGTSGGSTGNGPALSDPPIVVGPNTTVTFRDGGTGRTQTASLGGISVLPFGIPAAGSRVLMAAASDGGNPCEIEDAEHKQEKLRSTAEQPRKR